MLAYCCPCIPRATTRREVVVPRDTRFHSGFCTGFCTDRAGVVFKPEMNAKEELRGLYRRTTLACMHTQNSTSTIDTNCDFLSRISIVRTAPTIQDIVSTVHERSNTDYSSSYLRLGTPALDDCLVKRIAHVPEGSKPRSSSNNMGSSSSSGGNNMNKRQRQRQRQDEGKKDGKKTYYNYVIYLINSFGSDHFSEHGTNSNMEEELGSGQNEKGAWPE